MTTAVLIMVGIWVGAAAMTVWMVRMMHHKDKDDPRAVAMPEELIKATPREIGQMVEGDEGWIHATAISVNTRGHAFVHDATQLLEEEPFSAARIRRVAEGVEVTLINRRDSLLTYERRPIYRSLKYLPVVRLTVELAESGRKQ